MCRWRCQTTDHTMNHTEGADGKRNPDQNHGDGRSKKRQFLRGVYTQQPPNESHDPCNDLAASLLPSTIHH